jgi:hypothetical protein
MNNASLKEKAKKVLEETKKLTLSQRGKLGDIITNMETICQSILNTTTKTELHEREIY